MPARAHAQSNTTNSCLLQLLLYLFRPPSSVVTAGVAVAEHFCLMLGMCKTNACCVSLYTLEVEISFKELLTNYFSASIVRNYILQDLAGLIK